MFMAAMCKLLDTAVSSASVHIALSTCSGEGEHCSLSICFGKEVNSRKRKIKFTLKIYTGSAQTSEKRKFVKNCHF